MKKFLLIPILLIAGVVSASACGTCAAHAKPAAKACPTECAKACCDKSKAECAKAKAECAKKVAAAAAKKGCCPSAK